MRMRPSSFSSFSSFRLLAGVGLAWLVAAAGCQAEDPAAGNGSGGAAVSASGAGGQTGGGGTGGAGAAGGTGSGGATGGAGGGPPAPGTGGASGAGGSSAGQDTGSAGSTDASSDAQSTDGAASPDVAGDAGAAPAGAVTWAIDNLQSIGGHRTMVLGAPMVIDTPAGKALQFDGNDDALFVETHPLARLQQFTVEIYFRPDAGGSPAQRFFHMQDDATGGRVLFETRLPGSNSWVLDVFIESTAGEVAVYDARKTHPLGAWYHLAAVVDGQRATSYVNGVEQVSFPLAFRPHQGGRTSIGVRITRMYFFKGAMRAARFTPRVLKPAEFLPPP